MSSRSALGFVRNTSAAVHGQLAAGAGTAAATGPKAPALIAGTRHERKQGNLFTEVRARIFFFARIRKSARCPHSPSKPGDRERRSPLCLNRRTAHANANTELDGNRDSFSVLNGGLWLRES
jgi:hypothetical protein